MMYKVIETSWEYEDGMLMPTEHELGIFETESQAKAYVKQNQYRRLFTYDTDRESYLFDGNLRVKEISPYSIKPLNVSHNMGCFFGYASAAYRDGHRDVFTYMLLKFCSAPKDSIWYIKRNKKVMMLDKKIEHIFNKSRVGDEIAYVKPNQNENAIYLLTFKTGRFKEDMRIFSSYEEAQRYVSMRGISSFNIKKVVK